MWEAGTCTSKSKPCPMSVPGGTFTWKSPTPSILHVSKCKGPSPPPPLTHPPTADRETGSWDTYDKLQHSFEQGTEGNGPDRHDAAGGDGRQDTEHYQFSLL